MKMSMSARIRQHIFSLAEGKLFTSSDLLSYGTRGTVDQTLNRLTKRGVIVKLTHGVFMRETASGWRPSIEEVAIVKAQAFGKEIYAYKPRERKQGGLSSEKADADSTFLTSGCSSSFMYDNRRIFFKGASPGKLRKMQPLTLPGNPAILNFAPGDSSDDMQMKTLTVVETVQEKPEPDRVLSQLPQWLSWPFNFFMPGTKAQSGEPSIQLTSADLEGVTENQ